MRPVLSRRWLWACVAVLGVAGLLGGGLVVFFPSLTARPVRATSPTAIAPTSAASAAADTSGAKASIKIDVSHAPAHGATTLGIRMGTTLVWDDMLQSVPNGQRALDNLQPAVIRIHAGDDGTTPSTAPDQMEGRWDFTKLDDLMISANHAGAQVLLNIKFAPDWQWTCSAPETGQTGQVRDQTYQQYAAYLARIINYYNKGLMTDENGTVHMNPHGTSNAVHYLEPWNEPDGTWETPCSTPASLDPGGEALTPSQYVTMWNAATAAVLAIDPTVKFVGPATADPTTDHSPDYIPALLAGAKHKPDVISVHGYATWDNGEPDAALWNGDSNIPGLAGLMQGVQQDKAWAPDIPLWLDEGNMSADWGEDPAGRPSGACGVAWVSDYFLRLAQLGVASLELYDFIDSPQYGLISDQNGAARLSYWRDQLLGTALPAGAAIRQTSSAQPGVDAFAVQRADGSIAVLVVNRRPSSTRGVGLPATVTMGLTGLLDGQHVTAVNVRQIDKNTDPAHGPNTRFLTASASQHLSFPGYGMALLTFSLSA
jgi:hypothetical protein